jgi:hypothetical protein
MVRGAWTAAGEWTTLGTWIVSGEWTAHQTCFLPADDFVMAPISSAEDRTGAFGADRREMTFEARTILMILHSEAHRVHFPATNSFKTVPTQTTLSAAVFSTGSIPRARQDSGFCSRSDCGRRIKGCGLEAARMRGSTTAVAADSLLAEVKC